MILDTCVLVDAARGDAGAIGLLEGLRERREGATLPAIVVAEYLAGSRDAPRDLATLRSIGAMVPLDEPAAVEAGRIAREALARGRFPGWNDCLIAAVAAVRDEAIATRNGRHYAGAETVTY